MSVLAEHDLVAAGPPVRYSARALHHEIVAHDFETDGEPSENPADGET